MLLVVTDSTQPFYYLRKRCVLIYYRGRFIVCETSVVWCHHSTLLFLGYNHRLVCCRNRVVSKLLGPTSVIRRLLTFSAQYTYFTDLGLAFGIIPNLITYLDNGQWFRQIFSARKFESPLDIAVIPLQQNVQ
jgi:hypothetical protein